MKKEIRSVEDRLIVAADFFELAVQHGREEVYEAVISLAQQLSDTGVCIKLNSALRAGGYSLLDEVKWQGLPVFADLKLVDIPSTLQVDGALLKEAEPDFLTVHAESGPEGIRALHGFLENTEILLVAKLSAKHEHERQSVIALGKGPKDALDGVVMSSEQGISTLRTILGSSGTVNAVNIRPRWFEVKDDDQWSGGSLTPSQAIRAGADRVIVGRPITQSPDPVEAVMRILEEIDSAL